MADDKQTGRGSSPSSPERRRSPGEDKPDNVIAFPRMRRTPPDDTPPPTAA